MPSWLGRPDCAVGSFAPAKLGGAAGYVLVNGISMEPRFHTGDLVIVRQADRYQVGIFHFQ